MNRNAIKTVFLACVLFVVPLCTFGQQPSGEPTADAEEVFAQRVLPIFKARCFSCHGDEPDDLRGEFDMRTLDSILKGGESGDPGMVPGNADQSLIFQAINWDELEMPPKENDRLNADQIQYVKRWINDGAPWPSEQRIAEILRTTDAKWNTHEGVKVKTSRGLSDDWTNRRYKLEDLWAYQPIRNVEFEIQPASRNPIDVFINRKLTAAGITPLPKADRAALIRRLTYDLTGLPPTPESVQAFVNDTSDDAIQKLINQLLASPRYGEQWGKHWLDVVRYADSAGFSNDFARPNAWRYRDYVIRSFNMDKPYDRFLQEQIAGDELFPEDPDSQIATGFLRMGPWEHTAMSVAAVTRQQFLDDVTNQVGVTFLAHELRCASCHDHKFDPIPTVDYYRMQAVFASTQFVDRFLPYQSHENTTGFEEGKTRIENLQKLKGPKSLTTIPRDQWPVESWDADTETKGHKKVANKRTQILNRELKRFKPFALSVYSGPDRDFTSMKIYAMMPKKKQMKGNVAETRILTGGSIESPSEPVTAGVMSVVESQRVKLNVGSGKRVTEFKIPNTIAGRRAALAKWMTLEDHPLTARVIANRVWQFHFGKGLAGNPNNFGATGKKPTHPELLDFLASYLIENDWSLKKLHRLILTSDTWQRATGPNLPSIAETDPDNLLYARFTPRRLSAEEIRDSMLFVSGELNLTEGGIPARPEINLEVAMQPRHIMGSVAPAYQPSPTPSQRNRRTIYAERIRTLRDPMLEVFNQPSLDLSCEARDASTITPQAFTLLNSQNSFDRSLAMAHRLSQSHNSIEDQIRSGFKIAFGRSASDQELKQCLVHYRQMLIIHQDSLPALSKPPTYVIREMVEEMTGLAFFWVEDLDVYAGDYQADLKPWDVSPEVRALADICLVLFNANEFVYVY